LRGPRRGRAPAGGRQEDRLVLHRPAGHADPRPHPHGRYPRDHRGQDRLHRVPRDPGAAEGRRGLLHVDARDPGAARRGGGGVRERTVIADSASKTYSMTGWRICYAANAKLAPVFTRWVTNTDSCPPHPNQYAVIEALTASQAPSDRMRDTFQKRRDHIVAGL